MIKSRLFNMSTITFNENTSTIFSPVIFKSRLSDLSSITLYENTSTIFSPVIFKSRLYNFSIITFNINSTVCTCMIVEFRILDSSSFTFYINSSTLTTFCSITIKNTATDSCIITINKNRTGITCWVKCYTFMLDIPVPVRIWSENLTWRGSVIVLYSRSSLFTPS